MVKYIDKMRLLGGIIVCQKVHEFNDMIRKLRKELFGKERTNSYCFAENMAIATLYGNLTPTEKFISSTMDGAEMVHMARTKMIQEVYAANSREHLEELVGAKLVNCFQI